MTTVISVRFRSGCKTYFFDPGDVQVQTGDHVIVETAQGLEYAQCTMGNHPVDDCCVIQPLRPMVRVATENDRRTAAHNRTREKEAFDICQRKILQHNLEMSWCGWSAASRGTRFCSSSPPTGGWTSGSW